MQVDQEGVSKMDEVEAPYLNDTDVTTNHEVEQPKKGMASVFIFIGLVVVLFGGMAVTAVLFLGGEDSETKISLSSDPLTKDLVSDELSRAKDVTPKLTTSPKVGISAPPALPVIRNAQPDYQIEDETSSSINKEQFDQLISALDVINTKLRLVEEAVKKSNLDVQNLNLSFGTSNEKLDALIASSEMVAGQVTRQVTQVESVKKMVGDETERKVKSAGQPSFRVAGKSLWGNTVYLTIATEDKFEQQATIGATVTGWTLRKVDLKDKLSTWQNVKGDEYVLDIP